MAFPERYGNIRVSAVVFSVRSTGVDQYPEVFERVGAFEGLAAIVEFSAVVHVDCHPFGSGDVDFESVRR